MDADEWTPVADASPPCGVPVPPYDGDSCGDEAGFWCTTCDMPVCDGHLSILNGCPVCRTEERAPYPEPTIYLPGEGWVNL